MKYAKQFFLAIMILLYISSSFIYSENDKYSCVDFFDIKNLSEKGKKELYEIISACNSTWIDKLGQRRKQSENLETAEALSQEHAIVTRLLTTPTKPDETINSYINQCVKEKIYNKYSYLIDNYINRVESNLQKKLIQNKFADIRKTTDSLNSILDKNFCKTNICFDSNKKEQLLKTIKESIDQCKDKKCMNQLIETISHNDISDTAVKKKIRDMFAEQLFGQDSFTVTCQKGCEQKSSSI